MSAMMESDSVISMHFDSILDLLDHKVDSEIHQCEFDKNLNKSDGKKYGPTNSCGSDVIEHALVGDYELEKIVSENIEIMDGHGADDCDQVAKIKKRKVVYGDCGDEIDIHKIYQGSATTAWRKSVSFVDDSEFTLATLFIEIGGNWDESASSSIWVASVAVKIIKELEELGKSVRVIVGTLSTGSFAGTSKKATTSIVVKEYGEPVVESRLAAMCHLGFFRIFCFAAFYSDSKYTPVSGLGRFANIEYNTLPVHIQSDLLNGRTRCVIVRSCNSLPSALKQLRRAYREMADFKS